MSAYRQVISEIIALVEEQARPLTVQEVSLALGIPMDEIRRQVDAYSEEISVRAHERFLTDVYVYILTVGESVPPTLSPEDEVHVEGRANLELLGTERFDASVLAPLYEAAADLAMKEPDNEALASAIHKLLDRFLPGVRPSSRFQADTIAEVARAIGDCRRVRIRYSRAWNPGVFERVIEPYELVRTGRGAEVHAGPVQEDGQIRTYLVNRIRHLETLAERFQRPADVDARVAASTAAVTVTGVAPAERLWAVRAWAEEVRELGPAAPDGGSIRFEARLLPPVEWRAALMLVIAGPEVRLDEPRFNEEARVLARRLWAQHGLAEDGASA
ncbi:MAG: WYL domain-containing protein [Candidatus Nanopelagicales bacterium]